MENSYDFTFRNTLEHVYFHDNVIEKAVLDNDNLVLYFDWFYLLNTHPLNDTDDYKQIDNVIVCFENVKPIISQWHDLTKAVNNAIEKKEKSGDTNVYLQIDDGEIEIHNINLIDALNNLEVVSLNVIKNDTKNICKISGDRYRDSIYNQWMRKIEFEYSNDIIWFNL